MLLGEQAQGHLDDKAWGDHKGGVFCFLQESHQWLGRAFGCQALLRWGTVGV